jgi:Pregnancy-associated plasma protein-A/Secretion system C-terminal sorting domain
VVHVLYKNAAQNISNAQIYSQIDILNADYRRLNADTLNTPAMFDSIAADIEVEFCLASIDPDGNPSNGITRTSTSGGQLFGFFSPIFEDAKFDSLGGHDAWPADQYLNMWVCEAFPGLLGYAQFPGGDPATDGVVISYQAFGNTGTVTAPSTLGRTASHEVGHWMGLYHIWGDDQDCTGSDSIFDTPNATGASSSDCESSRNSCSNEDAFWGAFDPNDMVQNYMDYSHDSCMNMFTLGQKARMHSFLNSDPMRMALFNSPAGCNLVGLPTSPRSTHDFEIFPNPTDGMVRVNYLGSARPEMSVELIDLAGRVVYHYAATDYSYNLDLSDRSAGIYTLRITGEAGVTTRKLILE